MVAQERGGPVDDGDGVLHALGPTERVREHERRPERHLGVVAGDGERLLQVDLARGLAGGGLGHPELEQEPGTLDGRRRLGQSATQEDRRGLGRPAPRRGARGVHEAPRDRVIAGRLGGQQMLGCVLLPRRLAVHQLGRAAVRQRALGDRELLVDARAHERMDEGQRPVGLEDPRRHQRVRRFGRLGEVELGQGGRARQLGALEHRHRAGEARRGRGQATQAQLDPAARRARADRLDARRRPRVGAHALRADGLDQLADEERRAAGGAVARGREGRVGRHAEALLHHPAHGGEAQRRGLDDLGARVGDQRGQQMRLLALGLGAGGDQQGDLQLLQAGEQIGKEAQRRGVGPVRVVDAEHDQLVRGEVRAQPVEAVQDGERRVGRRRRRLALLQRAGQAEHACGQPRRALQ